MAYNELIKNFEKIRAYMREFYIYGFKSREEYAKKSLRSYDDERRRIESYLFNYMRFERTQDGKNVFISIDSRLSSRNPLYSALKSKSFTDGDITLHFIIFDILYDERVFLSLNRLMEIIDKDYLSHFKTPLVFDESTLRKKLKEYIELGIIVSRKQGKRLTYGRAKNTSITDYLDAIAFYAEIAPCGVIGSFIGDKVQNTGNVFAFKHHYIQSALDSDVLCSLFLAMQSKSSILVDNLNKKRTEPKKTRLIPLKIRISAQDGRQYLIAYQLTDKSFSTFRLDYLSNVKIEEVAEDFDYLRGIYSQMESKMWGVNCKMSLKGKEHLEHVEFTVKIDDNEDYIVRRLEREKRIGKVEKIDKNNYRFSADVYETSELLPWIRTFICRITKLNFSNRTVENQLKQDILDMYKLYGLNGGKL